MPSGKAFFGAEASLDLFLGDGHPGPIIRGGAHGGYNVTNNWSLLAFVVLGVGYSYPKLAPTLVVGAVAVMVLVVWLGLRQSRR